MTLLIHSILLRLTISMWCMQWSHIPANEIIISCARSLHGHLLRRFGRLLVLQLSMRVVVSPKQSDNIGSHGSQHAMFDVVMKQLLRTLSLATHQLLIVVSSRRNCLLVANPLWLMHTESRQTRNLSTHLRIISENGELWTS